MKKCFCTICTESYIPYALALYDSLHEYDKDVVLNVLVVDGEKRTSMGNVNFFDLKDTWMIGRLIAQKYKDSQDSLRWANKPVFLEFLLSIENYDSVIYVDTDINFFGGYDFLFDLLEKNSIILSPHWRGSVPGVNQPLTNFTDGFFNAGFIGAGKAGLEAVRWWKKWCEYSMEHDYPSGLYADQKYLDIMPFVFENVFVLKHMGCNIANWNKNVCARSRVDGKILINNYWPIIFIHFTRTLVDDIKNGGDPFLKSYYDIYRKRIKNHEFSGAMEKISSDSVPVFGPKHENPAPQFPRKLPGSFWGVTTFFNPAKYGNKADNYRIFRKRSHAQGLKLLTVELAFDQEPFTLTNEDADILIQIRGDSKKNVMWQKEALINIGLKRLPADCDKVAWIDCDLIFKNDNWIKETSELLEKYIAVQPFSYFARLPRGVYDADGREMEAMMSGEVKTEKGIGVAFGFAEDHPGFCWAFRKDFITRHMLFSEMIVGSADMAMFLAFCGDYHNDWLNRINLNQLSRYLQWAEPVYKDIQGSVYHADGAVLHLWHGDFGIRMYQIRNDLLNFFEFDPEKDIRLSSNGILEWASEKPDLHKAVEEYFQIRDEEGSKVFTSFVISQLHGAKSSLGHARRELDSAKGSLNSMQGSLGSIQGSLSWRITAPLRYIHSKTLFKAQKKILKTIGLIGQGIKKISPGIYHGLKQYFPDR